MCPFCEARYAMLMQLFFCWNGRGDKNLKLLLFLFTITATPHIEDYQPVWSANNNNKNTSNNRNKNKT